MIKLTLVLVLWAGIATAAEWPPQKKKTPPPPPRPATSNTCAQYGDGFVLLPGTNTCVKAGGSLQVDIGRSSR